MNFGQQKAYTARSLQDVDTSGTPNYTYWPEALIEDLLNQGLQDACRRSAILKQVVSFVQDPTESDVGLYIADFQFELDEVVFLQDDTSRLCQTSCEKLLEADIDWNTREGGSPTDYALDYKRGAVKIYPRPESSALTTLKGQVTYLHPELVTDGEECLLPRSYHVLPCYFAIAEAYAVDNEQQDLSKHELWRNKYEKGLTEFITQTARNFGRERPVSAPSYI